MPAAVESNMKLLTSGSEAAAERNATTKRFLLALGPCLRHGIVARLFVADQAMHPGVEYLDVVEVERELVVATENLLVPTPLTVPRPPPAARPAPARPAAAGLQRDRLRRARRSRIIASLSEVHTDHRVVKNREPKGSAGTVGPQEV